MTSSLDSLPSPVFPIGPGTVCWPSATFLVTQEKEGSYIFSDFSFWDCQLSGSASEVCSQYSKADVFPPVPTVVETAWASAMSDFFSLAGFWSPLPVTSLWAKGCCNTGSSSYFLHLWQQKQSSNSGPQLSLNLTAIRVPLTFPSWTFLFVLLCEPFLPFASLD